MSRKMKPSGIEWIGDIPEEWEIGQIGQLYVERKEKVSDRDYPPLSVTMKGIVPQLSTAAKTDAHDDRKLVKKGDFAINSRSDRRGSCGISAYDGSVSLINTILSPRNEMNPDYYNWLFHTSLFSDEFYKWGHGIVDDLWTTSWQDMKKISVPYPSVSEQQIISSYLDTKCAHIDNIIEKTKASIEEYKKLKQAVITQAVTKGVRGDRPMKDSGIEWIGEIPEEWEIHKLCWDYSAMLGKMLDAKRVTGMKLHPYIKNVDVQWWSINTDSLDEMDFDDFEYERYTVKPGDLMICEGGEIGKCAIIPKGFPEGVYYQKALHRVRARNSKGNLLFLSYVMFAMAKGNSFNSTHEKATIAHLPGDALSQLRIPTPILDEQQEIVSYLDKKCTEIDAIITKKQQFITEMESYKKSMIYEYVTGKKEVPKGENRIEFSTDFKVALLMCKILQNTEIKGRIHMQKVLFSSDILLNLFELQYYRFPHGPYDVDIQKYEQVLSQNGWVDIEKSNGSICYKKTERFDDFTDYYQELFSDKDNDIKKICQAFNVRRTAKAEKMATVLASWNDFLIDGVTPTDEMIVNDIVTNWTENKANIDKSTWYDTISKLKEQGLIPKGFGKKTLSEEAAKNVY